MCQIHAKRHKRYPLRLHSCTSHTNRPTNAQLRNLIHLYNKQIMSREQKQTKRQTHYDRILYERRLELIDLVLQQGYTISEAASTLKIKLSTAKLIVQRYRKSKTIFRRKDEVAEQKKKKERQKIKSLQRTSSNSNIQIPLQAAVETAFLSQATSTQNQQSQNWIVFYLPPYQLFSQTLNAYSYI